VLDPRRRPLPQFLIIGAQRSGTTALYRHLIDHPHVRPGLRKEVQFLTLYWERGLPWYRRHFPLVSNPAWRTFEASPYYLFHCEAPVRAAAALPDARFIAVLREPAARALSHYRHNQLNGLEPLSFEQALEAEEARLAGDRTGRSHRLYSYASRGLYAEQLRRWHASVGDRLLVLLTEDLRHEPQRTLDRVFAFVGLDPLAADSSRERSSAGNRTNDHVPEGLRRRLQERFAAPNRELSALLGRDLGGWDDGVPAHGSPAVVPVRGTSDPLPISRT
jgi:Sulfotransferase domain